MLHSSSEETRRDRRYRFPSLQRPSILRERVGAHPSATWRWKFHKRDHNAFWVLREAHGAVHELGVPDRLRQRPLLHRPVFGSSVFCDYHELQTDKSASGNEKEKSQVTDVQ